MQDKVEKYLLKKPELKPITSQQYIDNTREILEMHNNWQLVMDSYDLEDAAGWISGVGNFISDYYIPKNKPKDIKEVKAALTELQKIVNEIDDFIEKYSEWDSESMHQHIPEFNKVFAQICKFHFQQLFNLSDIKSTLEFETFLKDLLDGDFGLIYDLGRNEIQKEREVLISKRKD